MHIFRVNFGINVIKYHLTSTSFNTLRCLCRGVPDKGIKKYWGHSHLKNK